MSPLPRAHPHTTLRVIMFLLGVVVVCGGLFEGRVEYVAEDVGVGALEMPALRGAAGDLARGGRGARGVETDEVELGADLRLELLELSFGHG